MPTKAGISLSPQHRPGLGGAVHDLLRHGLYLGLGQRALRGLERDGNRQRLLPLAHALAGIDIEDAHVGDERPLRRTYGGDEFLGRQLSGHDEGEIPVHRLEG